MTDLPAAAQQPAPPEAVAFASFAQLRAAVRTEVAKVVVGQEPFVDATLAAMAVGGHLLLQGPPGVAKTLLASALAKAAGLESRRAQFTPDMLPSDLTGTLMLRGAELAFRPGPVFTNILLADEVNRTPPKTQAALLEAMQERQVTVDGVAHHLPDPFTVLATLNPIEYEGTYPLPEAQLDRFLMRLSIGYPSADQEEALLRLPHRGVMPRTLADVVPVGGPAQLAAARREVDAVAVSDAAFAYVTRVVRRTRELPSVTLGASPRAGVHLLAAAKAWACLAGRDYVLPDDIAALAGPVLCHRLVLSPEAELDRYTPEQAVAAVLASVPVPR
ncbi:MAG TPA: MoxR family ATPase [Acidimicrobiales bacterium]|nr:MoxR family ATPase [Acidimicrobiales bacterium]